MKPLFLAIALSLFGLTAYADDNPKLPNIVYILADDLGYGDVQCLNPERGKIATPHMDQVAADGMTFLDAHTTCLLYTSPSPRD